jgi:hypothetical protein
MSVSGPKNGYFTKDEMGNKQKRKMMGERGYAMGEGREERISLK